MATAILKTISADVALPVAMIFRKSLNAGIVPRGRIIANLMPVFKKGDKHNVTDYRPVSLTSQICNVAESTIKDEPGEASID